ncbi:MAG: TonB-dependent receptor [Porphyromonadaceae bacterium]|nr:MAG: TonB-dependent receptor [Porphyromonadaceae bacterium]
MYPNVDYWVSDINIKMTNISRFLIFLLTSSLSIYCPAQNVTINGRVSCAETGEFLIGANVYQSDRSVGATTNEYGYFSLKTNPGLLSLTITYVGYTPMDTTMEIRANTLVSFRLSKQKSLSEVVIIGRKNRRDLPTNMMTLSPKTYSFLPSLAGESDIIKTLQLMPGIQSGNEGTTGLIVRGGSPDQNLFLVDGIPLYNISHLYGFLSVFNEDAINNVDVVKGGFPAKYGGRLSSVIDVRLREGNPEKHEVKVNLGLIASGFSASGPLIKNRATYMVSARRSFLDLFTRPVALVNKIMGKDYGSSIYSLGDLNAKLSFNLSPKNRLYLSFYAGQDRYGRNTEMTSRTDSLTQNGTYAESLRWGNVLGSLAWTHVFGDKLFMNTSLSRTSYHLQSDYENSQVLTTKNDVFRSDLTVSYLSDIQDYSARVNFDYALSGYHHINFGTVGTSYRFSPGVSTLVSKVDSTVISLSTPINKLQSGSVDFYIEDRIELPSGFYTRAGLRSSNYFTANKSYFALEPRLSMGMMFSGNLNLQLSYSKMQQPLHLLSNSGLGMPTDLWVPSTDSIPPQQCHQFSIGGSKTFKGFTVGIEGYYKRFSNLISYGEGASFLMNSKNWQSMIVQNGIGKAYGAELLIRKEEGKLKGWLSYTLSWNKRQFSELNGGKWFDYRFDRRHDLSINLQYYFRPTRVFSCSWVYATGQPVTLPSAIFPYVDYPMGGNNLNYTIFNNQNVLTQFAEISRRRGELIYYNGLNNYRLPAYHRLDVSLSFIKQLKHCERTLAIGLYNAYSRRNAFYVSYVDDTSGAWAQKFMSGFKIITLFPIIPCISYRLRF